MSFAWNTIGCDNRRTAISSIGISLGWNCHTTDVGVRRGLRELKQNGYKTCPFDLMISNYEGVIQCLYDDFKDIANPECLKLVPSNTTEEISLMNTKYNFCHNHESVGHANLHITENWEGGKTHFVDNNFEKFIERLNRRVQNFRDYMNSGKHINFLITDFDENLSELHTCIKTKYPMLSYSIIRFDLEEVNGETSKDYFNRHMEGLGVSRLFTR